MGYLIGHLVGEWLLQTDWMRLQKRRWGRELNSDMDALSPLYCRKQGKFSWELFFRGEAACHLHCFLYSLAVAAFTGWWDWPRFVAVYVTHYIVDRTPYVRRLADKAKLMYYMRRKGEMWTHFLIEEVVHLVSLYTICKSFGG